MTLLNHLIRLCKLSALSLMFSCSLPALLAAPLNTNNAHLASTEQEQRIWLEEQKLELKLLKTDALFIHQATTDYLQSVINRIYPKYKRQIKIKLLNDPKLNAFALANGSIYFNIGLLARLDNEAQLATVLAHEGAHFIHKHALKFRKKLKSTTKEIALSTGYKTTVKTSLDLLSGYSREQEREADVYAFHSIKKAGYDIRQSPYTFQKLLAEAKANQQQQSSFFSSHPKLTERINSYQQLIQQHYKTTNKQEKKARIAQALFLQKTQALRLADLKSNLSYGRYNSLILILENPANHYKYPSFAHYYLGEAYRLRAATGDQTRSYLAYRTAIKKSPNFPHSYRALGVYYMKQKNYKKARHSFSKFLSLAPGDKEADYVKYYLKTMPNN